MKDIGFNEKDMLEYISPYKQELSKFVTDHKNAVDNKMFSYLYDAIAFDHYAFPPSAFTALLLLMDINPLLYMINVSISMFRSLPIRFINIPAHIISIENSAFENCSSLEKIYIPRSVKSILPHALSRTTWLENVLYSGSEAEWLSMSICNDWAERTGLNEILFNSKPIEGS